MADVISRRAQIRVTTYDLGLGDPGDDRALVYHSSWTETIESVADLGRADVDRRTFLITAPFAASATLGPSRDWLLNTLDQLPGDRPHVHLDDVAKIRNKFAEFQQMDIFKGGGEGRLRLAKYTSDRVIPLLRRPQQDDVRSALYGAAAEQVYLLGWMAYDNGEHGVAQRYLIQALRLAQESHDSALGAHVLAGMADQATLLGNPKEGLRLAQAGRHGLGGTRSPACLADLWVLEARAAAVLGDSVAASRAAAAAERAFEVINVEDEPEWARFIDQAYVFGELANAFRDIGNPREAADRANRSIRATEQQKRARRGALSHAALAAAHLQSGELEAAHREGLTTIKLAKKVKSSRSVEAVSDVAQRMRAIGTHPLVDDFCDRARTFVAA
ncbi:hypothetical protein ACFWVM_29075 [Nocardia fluminea]|uniref:hypothetical protein n=1 Tax=Nocardia fluminea TaxID=134984 RepID=UPI0036485671